MNTKAKGDIGEIIAAEYLKKKGYTILHKNLKLASCEVDIVAEAFLDEFGNLTKKNNKKSSLFSKIKSRFCSKNQHKTKAWNCGERTLVFVEVKTRISDEHGAPEEAVDAYKIGRYIVAAKNYIVKFSEQNTPIRFDVIAVEGNKINHIENAFTENDARYSKNR